MSKRKLNRRQTWRIEKIQRERLARACKREENIDGNSSLGSEQEGLVIAHFGTQVEVEPKEQPGQHRRCHFRANLGSLVTGDRVVWRDGDPTGVVVAVEERDSELSRPDPHGDMKTIAANIDRILIVVASVPKPHTQLVDRYLVAAESLNIKPSLIINKIDLVEAGNQSVIEKFIKPYQSLGYEVITVSAREEKGLLELAALVKEHTNIFVGQSGVGKTSLINKLIPDLNLQIGELSQSSQKGTHTTTTAQLFHFPQGGRLIDSPGIREFGLWHMTPEEILHGFVEFSPFAGRCKFRNCRHEQEPNCAILHAHRDGHISDHRFSSYLALREQSESAEASRKPQ
ncbi:MAG: ribosome biogenesis GTPase [Cellvibrionaceae bacterium]|jgi:ribosome biogenesis GTPase